MIYALNGFSILLAMSHISLNTPLGAQEIRDMDKMDGMVNELQKALEILFCNAPGIS